MRLGPPAVLDDLLTVSDFECAAKDLLPEEFFAGVFGDGFEPGLDTNRRNVEAFQKLDLRPRVLTGGAGSLEVSVLGQQLRMPIMVAPAGLQDRYHPDGELATVRGAGAQGTLMALSAVSGLPVETVSAAASSPLWFQIYLFSDPELNRFLVQRAEQAGVGAIVLTVDNVRAPTRERDRLQAIQRHGRSDLEPISNLSGCTRPDLPTLSTLLRSLKHDIGWVDLEDLCAMTRLPVVVKGIQTAEDARASVAHGAAGIVVSNHGGHTLPGVRASIDALPEVVAAVSNSVEVYFDGGIRRGTDILKALALGARATFVGRAVIWGLTVAGQLGVEAVLEILHEELLNAVEVCGVRSISAVPRELVGPRSASAAPVRQVSKLSATG